MGIISSHENKITKRQLKDIALEMELIRVAKKEGRNEVSEQAPYMALNKNLIEPLLKWNFITVRKVGSHYIVSLTKEGQNAFKFLEVRVEKEIKATQ